MINKNCYIILIRHFKTYINSKNKEKINYSTSFENSHGFIENIKSFTEKYPQIKKIKFLTSDHERTLLTSLVISTKLKSEILKKKLKYIEIDDPVINVFVDRDPFKKNKNLVCEYFNKKIENSFNDNTLYVIVTHSSIIYNLYKCIFEIFTEDEFTEYENKKIHSYSFSYIIRNDNRISYSFNKKIKI